MTTNWVLTPTEFGLPVDDYKPVANPTTDLAASYYETLAVMASALSYVAPMAWATVSAGTGCTILHHAARWGDTNAVKPTLARVSTGTYTLTWAASYGDLNPTPARVATAAVSFRVAVPVAHHSEVHSIIASASANSVYVQTFTTAGAVGDYNFSVFMY